MKICALAFAVALAGGSLLAMPEIARKPIKFLGRDYEITRLTSEIDGRTEARAYVVAPDPLVSSVWFDTEVRHLLRPEAQAREAGYVWQIEAAKQQVAIGDGTLLFIERVGDRWLFSVFAVGGGELRDEEIIAVVERYRAKMSHADKEWANQRPNGTPAKSSPSNPSHGTAFPHP
ncbi:MAG TPA: hypothetical protein VK178_15380 [Opitutaceae bacterium]|nr:hypothetical protein [Opitutaceae bacterium]